jgi:hypothetical protein
VRQRPSPAQLRLRQITTLERDPGEVPLCRTDILPHPRPRRHRETPLGQLLRRPDPEESPVDQGQVRQATRLHRQIAHVLRLAQSGLHAPLGLVECSVQEEDGREHALCREDLPRLTGALGRGEGGAGPSNGLG